MTMPDTFVQGATVAPEVLAGCVGFRRVQFGTCTTSAAMTLDVYADLFESDLDTVAEKWQFVGTAGLIVHVFGLETAPTSGYAGGAGFVSVMVRTTRMQGDLNGQAQVRLFHRPIPSRGHKPDACVAT
jgi:hypothetical protein